LSAWRASPSGLAALAERSVRQGQNASPDSLHQRNVIIVKLQFDLRTRRDDLLPRDRTGPVSLSGDM